ncbi:mycothiol transferase [Actinacidiphila acididurans]|uniref:mycothiol transferase n=1 Tax=Actinacidiphila acididurans TaxID=2784346 RepID=UPI0027DD3C5F|nr:DUF664 domain-containing protein [Actinacidiphila acididurans]
MPSRRDSGPSSTHWACRIPEAQPRTPVTARPPLTEQLRTAVLPSDWTPLGLVKHLGYAERHWLQRVFLGSTAEVPWPGDDEERLTSEHPAEEVSAFHREQYAVPATTPLDARPAGPHGDDPDGEVSDLRAPCST